VRDLDLYKSLSRRDMEDDPDSWQFAPVLVSTNKERNNIIKHQSRLFAQHNETYVFKWRVYENWKLCKPDPQTLKKVVEEEAFFWQYFVPGADAFITFNINAELGLANGTPVKCHSLGFKEDKMIRSIQALINGDGDGDSSHLLPFGSEIELDSLPDTVFVEVLPSLDGKEPTARRKQQLSVLRLHSIPNQENKIIIPLQKQSKSSRDGSEWKGVNFTTHSSLSPVSQALFKYPFPMELAFAMTVHKAQGRTLSRIIVALSQQPNKAAEMKYAAVFVALSRVRHADHIRLLQHNHVNMSQQQGRMKTYHYLTELVQDSFVTKFYKGYINHNGVWDSSRVPP
jgi:hypothetical protein